jgi:hypothetical protein
MAAEAVETAAVLTVKMAAVGKDGSSGNDTRRELWRIISGSEVRFMWNITAGGDAGSRRLLVS